MCVLNSNDYVKLTRDYLKNYSCYMDYVEKAFARCDEIDLELADESIKTTTYGLEQGGGSELTPVERAASRRMKLKSEKANLTKLPKYAIIPYRLPKGKKRDFILMY